MTHLTLCERKTRLSEIRKRQKKTIDSVVGSLSKKM
jgi:hypothetical protein